MIGYGQNDSEPDNDDGVIMGDLDPEKDMEANKIF